MTALCSRGRLDERLWRRRRGESERLAVDRAGQGLADVIHSRGVESGDRLGQKGAWDGAEVVKAYGALDRHPIGWSDLHLGVDPADRAGHERDDHVLQAGDRFIACEHDDRPATFLLKFEPRDLAAGYQRSSRIASRAFASAHSSSATAASVEPVH